VNALACATSAAATPALSLRLVTSIAELRGLAPAWQELLEESSAAQPMCAPAWLLTWWENYGRHRQLRVGLFYEGKRLVGLAPLCRRTYWYRPGIPFRRLEFLGSNVDEDDGVCSEYLNFIVRQGLEEPVANAFAEALHAGAFGRWDECVFSAMDNADALTAALTAHRSTRRPSGCSVEQHHIDRSPYVPLPATWEEYLHSFNKKKRQSLTYALRDFHVWAETDWSLTVAQTEEELERGLQILMKLHRQRWQADGHDGAFAAPRFRMFHEQFARQALRQGQLLLMWITVRGAPVAALYGFSADGKVYFYQCGRVLDVPTKVRLGIVLVIFALQLAMQRGLCEFDFLAGAAQYKQLFATAARPIFEVRLARRGAREFLRLLAHKALGLGRTVRRSAGALANPMQFLATKPVLARPTTVNLS